MYNGFSYGQMNPQQINQLVRNMQNNFSPYTYSQPVSFAQQVPVVHGIDGAKSYPLPSGSSILLKDDEKPLFYLKQVDGIGTAGIDIYSFQKQQNVTNGQTMSQPVANAQVSDLERRLRAVEMLLGAKQDSEQKEKKGGKHE